MSSAPMADEAEDELAKALALSQATDVDVMESASALLALPKQQQDASLKIVSTLLGNLVKEPENSKFRSVRLSNAKIKAAIVDVPEGMKLMEACGFKKQDDSLVASDGAEAKAQQALAILQDATASFILSRELAHGSSVRCICSLPDGSVATGAMDNIVRHFQDLDSSAASVPRCFVGHVRTAGVDGVMAVCAVAGKEQELASAGRDGKVIIWDLATGQKKDELIGHGENVDVTNAKSIGALTSMANGTLVSGGWDKTARVWSATPRALSGHTVAVNAVCVLSGGEILTASGDSTLRIWQGDAAAPTKIITASSPVRAVCKVGVSGVAFASAHNDGKVQTWTSGGDLAKSAAASTSYLVSVAYGSRRETIATGGDDGAVKLWTVVLELIQTIDHPMKVFCVSFRDDGDLLTACEDEVARLWSRDSSKSAPSHILADYKAKMAAVAAVRGPASSSGGSAPAPSGVAVGCPCGGGTLPGGSGGPWDYEYPVELTGGRKMTLRWRKGESADAVANRFLSENGLPANHFPDVLAFVTQTQAQAAAGGGGGSAPPMGSSQSTYSYPVEVADGRRLTISWNAGEDPMQVAMRFALQHNIGPDELQEITRFVASAQGSPAPSAPPMAPNPAAVPAQAVSALVQMGFDEPRAREALQATGGNIEAAIAKLCG